MVVKRFSVSKVLIALFLVVNAVLLSASLGILPDAPGNRPARNTEGAASSPTETPDRAIDWTETEIPATITDCSVPPDAVTVDFTRTPDSQFLFNNSHDAVVLKRTNGGYSLIVHDFGGWRFLLRTDAATVPRNASEWQIVQNRVNGDHTGSVSIDSMVRVNGTYYAYQGGVAFVSEDLASERWTRQGRIPGEDHGVYHDAETGLFHLFYEAGNRSGHSGQRIGHATSPSGVGNWTVYPPVYTPPSGLKVGDFDVVKRNGVYVMFGDYTADHPKYSVSVWVNDNLYTNFTRLGNVMTPSNESFGTADYYGVQDPDVIENGATGEYVMFAHGHTGESGPRYMHQFPGQIEVDRSNWSGQCDCAD